MSGGENEAAGSGLGGLEGADEKLKFYSLLKNPVRREIIHLLDSNGEMAATEMRRRLKVSVGTLYYHLEFMQPFISQSGRRKYMLSERGRVLVSSMKLSDTLAEASVLGGRLTGLNRVLSGFSMFPAFQKVEASGVWAIPVSLISGLLYILLSWRVLNVQFLLHFRGVSLAEQAVVVGAVNMLLVFGFYALAGLVAARRAGGELTLLSSTPIAFTPANVFLAYLVLVASSGLVLHPLTAFVTNGLFILAHVWQLSALSAALVAAKGISWERALVVSVVFSYISFTASQYQLPPL